MLLLHASEDRPVRRARKFRCSVRIFSMSRRDHSLPKQLIPKRLSRTLTLPSQTFLVIFQILRRESFPKDVGNLIFVEA